MRSRSSEPLDGDAVEAAEGDTLLVALLTARDALRDSEFGDGRRAGFCLMGACQDCWVWIAQGERVMIGMPGIHGDR
ncbi:hypothetical protein FSB65_19370 [Paraburkholderia sp. JPY418]|uniref:(2Fe-2S)-binding protein n=1 Tax=Paraburkholderia youngii TaxID=2782701 RepID=A0A7Y6K4G0_9BURK|nr:hypothetical protein [Paraburkholderia youngii]NUY04211.1 hypothetical protein [Paraburkholderia youngii]NVI03673.1 hypothetical protein [Paraburkholderia youngii]